MHSLSLSVPFSLSLGAALSLPQLKLLLPQALAIACKSLLECAKDKFKGAPQTQTESGRQRKATAKRHLQRTMGICQTSCKQKQMQPQMQQQQQQQPQTRMQMPPLVLQLPDDDDANALAVAAAGHFS